MNNHDRIAIVMSELITRIYNQERKNCLIKRIFIYFLFSAMQDNFDKYSNSIVDSQNTQYDYASVMHYEKDAFSMNGLPTIEPLQSSISIGQRYNMSTTDIKEVRLFYNCLPSGVTLPPVPTTTTGE
jgi:hypothetical protein